MLPLTLPFLTRYHSPLSSLIDRTAAFVRTALAGNDASHDFAHIERVWALARTLATSEGLAAAALGNVELAALLHDIDDWKYSGSETAGVEAAEKFLAAEGVGAARVERICYIIKRVSFHDELGRSEEERRLQLADKELACVQDADRLDAIGAVGIARTFTYGGKKMRKLYSDNDLAEGPKALKAMRAADEAAAAAGAGVKSVVAGEAGAVAAGGEEAKDAGAGGAGGAGATGGSLPQIATKAEYGKGKTDASTTFHFHEKLFHLRGMMKTEAGRAVAEERHQFMATFLGRLYGECAGKV